MTTYKLTLSDGKRLDIKGTACGEAIAKAIDLYRGRTVTRCIAGDTDEHLDSRGIRVSPGWIEYEIPKHVALPEVEVKQPGPIAKTEAFDFLESIPVREPVVKKRKSKEKATR